MMGGGARVGSGWQAARRAGSHAFPLLVCCHDLDAERVLLSHTERVGNVSSCNTTSFGAVNAMHALLLPQCCCHIGLPCSAAMQLCNDAPQTCTATMHHPCSSAWPRSLACIAAIHPGHASQPGTMACIAAILPGHAPQLPTTAMHHGNAPPLPTVACPAATHHAIYRSHPPWPFDGPLSFSPRHISKR